MIVVLFVLVAQIFICDGFTPLLSWTACSSFTAISTGSGHTCALVGGGTVGCWGAGTNGQLGNGGTVESPVPVEVSSLTGATAVSAGTDHTCAIVGGGTIRCWGAGTRGQLGYGGTTSYPVPVEVSSLTGATALSAGREGTYHTCALGGGAVRCWGEGFSGQLGNGGNSGATTPVVICPPPNPTSPPQPVITPTLPPNEISEIFETDIGTVAIGFSVFVVFLFLLMIKTIVTSSE